MITTKILESIRDYSFEVHCPKIKIFQHNGIVLKGYGIIKINDYGVFYIEFICLEKNNIPNVNWSISLPDDDFDESQKIYLEAISLDGVEFQAEGFRIELHFLEIHKTSVHYILLDKIITIELTKDTREYFYIEFNQNIKIPRNKVNRESSTLGSESFSRNESVIDFNHENLKIRIVNDHKVKFIAIEECSNPDLILDCIKFYLGFCSGLLLQPYYSKHISSNQEVNTFYSANKLYLKKRYAPAIASNISDSEFRDGEYHFNILRNSIRLYKENPKHFLSIYAQWRRVWVSFNSEQDITNLVLTTAIEGLLNDIFIPIFKESKVDLGLERDIIEIKKIIEDLKIDALYKDKLKHAISYLKNITANKALTLLVEIGVLSKEEITAWKKLRNEVAHPKVRNNNLPSKYKEKANFIACLNLFNSLILQTLNYSGPRNYFSPIKDERIYLFHSKKLDE